MPRILSVAFMMFLLAFLAWWIYIILKLVITYTQWAAVIAAVVILWFILTEVLNARPESNQQIED